MKHKSEIIDLFLHMLQTLKLSLNASQNGFKAGSIFQILKNPIWVLQILKNSD